MKSPRNARRLQSAAKNAKQFVQNPDNQATAALLAGGLGLGATGLGALSAYSDQANEYLPTDPLAVAGRMAKNILSGPQMGAVGVDPLANARNHVASAGDIVGTEEMLEALAIAEMAQMKSEREAANALFNNSDLSKLGGVQRMIDQRTGILMQQPIQRADGSVAPMPFDTAQRLATEQVNMEMRAGNVY